jgi:hypothetical protein
LLFVPPDPYSNTPSAFFQSTVIAIRALTFCQNAFRGGLYQHALALPALGSPAVQNIALPHWLLLVHWGKQIPPFDRMALAVVMTQTNPDGQLAPSARQSSGPWDPWDSEPNSSVVEA